MSRRVGGLVVMVRLLIGLLIPGGRRLRHVAYLRDDVVYRRFPGLRVVLCGDNYICGQRQLALM